MNQKVIDDTIYFSTKNQPHPGLRTFLLNQNHILRVISQITPLIPCIQILARVSRSDTQMLVYFTKCVTQQKGHHN